VARLLTAKQTAAYLGRKSTEVLRTFPVKPVFVGRSQMWDRRHIDLYLDSLSGLEERNRQEDVVDEINRHFQTN
jgi:hypothetical protein